MWQRFKEFVFITPEEDMNMSGQMIASERDEIVTQALARYCEICHIGFKNPGATKLHKRFKHGSNK